MASFKLVKSRPRNESDSDSTLAGDSDNASDLIMMTRIPTQATAARLGPESESLALTQRMRPWINSHGDLTRTSRDSRLSLSVTTPSPNLSRPSSDSGSASPGPRLPVAQYDSDSELLT